MATLCLLVVYGVYHVWVMVQLHPYEYIYCNPLTGGVRGAAGARGGAVPGYETDYWATSYKEAVMEIEAYLRRRDGTEFARREYTVFINQEDSAATYYFPRNFREVATVAEADVYLATTRGVALNEYSDHEVVVRRFGVPLAVAKILRPQEFRS